MQDQKIIKSKVGLLKLAQTLGSVSEACKVIGSISNSTDISDAFVAEREVNRLSPPRCKYIVIFALGEGPRLGDNGKPA